MAVALVEVPVSCLSVRVRVIRNVWLVRRPVARASPLVLACVPVMVPLVRRSVASIVPKVPIVGLGKSDRMLMWVILTLTFRFAVAKLVKCRPTSRIRLLCRCLWCLVVPPLVLTSLGSVIRTALRLCVVASVMVSCAIS